MARSTGRARSARVDPTAREGGGVGGPARATRVRQEGPHNLHHVCSTQKIYPSKFTSYATSDKNKRSIGFLFSYSLLKLSTSINIIYHLSSSITKDNIYASHQNSHAERIPVRQDFQATHDWETSETRHRRTQAKLRNRSKTMAGPLEDTPTGRTTSSCH